MRLRGFEKCHRWLSRQMLPHEGADGHGRTKMPWLLPDYFHHSYEMLNRLEIGHETQGLMPVSKAWRKYEM